MERFNLLCETENCGLPAESFGMKGNIKIKRCAKHTAALIEKNMEIFNIKGYDFISTLDDAAVFEERITLVDKGIGNLTVLEASCESELNAALKAIENAKKKVMSVVEGRFEEMKVAVTMSHEHTKRQLAQIYENLKQFLTCRETQLSPTEQMACLNLPVVPKFLRFGVLDESDSLSAILSDSWSIASADIHSTLECLTKKGTASVCMREGAAVFPEKGTLLKFADSFVDEDGPLDQKNGSIVELLKLEKERIQSKWKWLQRSWGLRQQYAISSEATAEVGKQLASLLSRQHGQFSEAEQVLQYCYNITQTLTPLSEDSMLVCNDICRVYFDSAQYEAAERLGIWVLSTFETANFSAEHYWTALLYLTYSQRRQSKHKEATGILENWRTRRLNEENIMAEMLKSLTVGIGAYFDKRREEAETCLQQAKRIGLIHFPTSLFTALALYRLTFLSIGNAQEQYHRLAQSIFEVMAPMCVDSANNLGNLGRLYFNLKQMSEAETCHRQAQSIYEITAPRSIDAALNSMNLGIVYFSTDRLGEAELCYRQAQSLYDVSAPMSMHAATNVMNLGILLKQTKKWREAEECYRLAQCIYGEIAPQSEEAAGNLYNMGLLYEAKKQTEQAIECFQAAASTYAHVENAALKSRAEDNIARLNKFAI